MQNTPLHINYKNKNHFGYGNTAKFKNANTWVRSPWTRTFWSQWKYELVQVLKLWQIKMHRIAGHGGTSLSPASRRAGPQSKVPPQRRREGSRIQLKDSHWQHSPSQNPWRPSTRPNNWETILLCISKARGRLIWTGRTGVEAVQFVVSCLSLQWQEAF